MRKFTLAAVLLAGGLAVQAQEGVSVHGSLQSDILVPENDNATNAKKGTDGDVLTNTYAEVGLYSKHFDAGVRFEYLDHPLQGYEPEFKGWGVPFFYVKGKLGGAELTLGDFYEQFGSGFILRTYEERNLGIDNSIRGARVKINSVKGLRITALGGVQRRYWDWDMDTKLAGGDVETDLSEYIPSMADKNITWTLGASYVFKHEKDDNAMVPGKYLRLNFPSNVHAFDVRTKLNISNVNLLGEFAWKSQDPCSLNDYTYGNGHAEMFSASYSKSGASALVQVKRSENMGFRSERMRPAGTAAHINHMPAFSYEHTYDLASMYPYATQSAPGEWAFQGAFSYNFKRHTSLGGKYGTKMKLNISYIRGLDHDAPDMPLGTLWGTNGTKTDFFGMGGLYYQDVNVQMEKKLSKTFSLNMMYMYQKYNKTVVERHGGMIESHILVGEGKWKMSRKTTLRGELQWLTTEQDKGDWAFGLLELSCLPYLMFTVSDEWNYGSTHTHYYMGNITANYKSHRLMVGYGRTRDGMNCSGGVCRYVPASRGVRVSYNYTF